MAREFDDRARRRDTKSLAVDVARGEELAFHLALPGAHVEEAVQRLTWRGQTQAVQFVVLVPSQGVQGSLFGKVIVSLGGVPVGDVKFMLNVLPAAARQ